MYSMFYLYSATLWQEFLPPPPLARNLLLVSCKRLPCTTARFVRGTNVATQLAFPNHQGLAICPSATFGFADFVTF